MILFTVILTACSSSKEDTLLEQVEQTEESQIESVEKESTKDLFLYVYICGAVKNPDVYPLSEGSRIKDAVEKAGGFSENADQIRINLAERVVDGQQIYIPKKGEEVDNQQTEGESSQTKLDLNTATREQLMTLPGIGESKADAILSYREEHGSFQKTEDLKKISGIKDGVFQKLKDLIMVH